MEEASLVFKLLQKITITCSIFGLIIISKNIQMRSSADGHLTNVRHQVIWDALE